MEWLVIGISLLLGFYMAWTIGANDFANSMADAVGSRAVSIKKALMYGCACELAGSVLVGAHVTDTVRKGIVDPQALAGAPAVLALGMTCALVSAALWLHIATWLGMPVSTTHSIVGAVAGFGVVAAGWSAVDWAKLAQIAASWLISPVAGLVLSYSLFRLFTWLILGRENPAVAAIRAAPLVVFLVGAVVSSSVLWRGGLQRVLGRWLPGFGGVSALLCAAAISVALAGLSRFLVRRHLRENLDRPLVEQLGMVERVFAPLVVATSCSVAFAHGANDVANAVGPLAAVVDIVRSGTVKMQVVVPFWILGLGGLGIIVGVSTYGYRVLRTIGTKITQLTPSRGVAADLATCTTVLVCCRLKLPVSTTHTIVGAIIGIGLARGLGGVNRRVIRDIFGSWLVTVPAAALLAVILFVLGKAVHLDLAIKSVMGAGG